MSTNPSTSSTSGGGGGGGGSSGGGGPCGACKFLRRKCVSGCVFAPYFDSEQGAAHFAAVHKVFGASNVSKLLSHLPVQRRHDAVVTICYEAQARLRDPVYGCVSQIFALQQQVVNLQAELSYFQAHLATLEGHTPTPPPQPPQASVPPAGLTINDLSTASPAIGSYDISSLLEPMVQPSWTMQPPRTTQMDPRQFMSLAPIRAPTDLPPPSSEENDFHELARELMLRPNNVSSGSGACKIEGPSLPPHDR
ncbi:LOB domain-containing protein 30-like [Rutidosis leptorrhynchoides]|uniref:LOB domain-containing protein 30-like n=1 Tax=Rutidosis leptorrhynchoides TaxID=125765 RepID=UPI003A98E924